MTSFYRPATREFVQDSCTQLLMTCGSYCIHQTIPTLYECDIILRTSDRRVYARLILCLWCNVGATAGHLTELHKNSLQMNNCIITSGNFTTSQYHQKQETRQCIQRTSPELFNLFKILLNKIFYITIYITLKQDHKH